MIEAISTPYRQFRSANDFLSVQGKPPYFQVQFVGLSKSVEAPGWRVYGRVHQYIDMIGTTDLIIIRDCIVTFKLRQTESIQPGLVSGHVSLGRGNRLTMYGDLSTG